jgi:hypothetical protein
MARNRFGGDAATWFASPTGPGKPINSPRTNPVLTFWSGTPDDLDRVQYDDLRGLDDPTTVISTVTGLSTGGAPEFFGPDDATVKRMWASPDGGATGTWITTTTMPIPTTAADVGALPDDTVIPSTAADVGAVPTTRQVNGKALSTDVTLAAGDVGAATTAQGAKADTAVQPAALDPAIVSRVSTDLANPASQIGGVANSAFVQQSNPVRAGAFFGLRAQLDAGLSTAIGYITDSTGNASNEHPYLFGQALGQLYPGHTVRWHAFDGTTKLWAQPVVIQTGTAGSRRVTFDGSTNATLSVGDSAINSITGDLDVRVKASSPNWAATGVHTLVGKFDTAGKRAWSLYIDGTSLNLWHSADGTNLINQAVPLPALTNGQAYWFRATLDVDNGASGHTATFYYSTNEGASWTQIGTPQTTAGVTSLADVTADVTLGAAQGGANWRWTGAIYEAEIRDGINGAIVCPTIVDLWTKGPSTFNGVFSGAPILDIWCAGASGYGITPMIANIAVMCPAAGQATMLVGTSHNDTGRVTADYWTDWDTLVNSVKARCPGAGIGVFSENPQTAPQPAYQIAAHFTRRALLFSYAAQRNYTFIDVMKAFEDDPRPISDLVGPVDGVHPTQAGEQLWADTVMASFNQGA